MFFAISAAQRPWIAGVFAALGVLCELLNHHEVGLVLITAGVTLVTVTERGEK